MKSPSIRFIVAALLFFLIIIIGVIIKINSDKLSYSLSRQETLDIILSLEDEMFPDEALGIELYGDSLYAFVDIRSEELFREGHITGAINVPSTFLLSDDNLEIFKGFNNDSITVILYGNEQLDANGPWMILKQLGFSNIKVLLGGYAYYSNQPEDMYDIPEIPEYFVEEPKYDFVEIMEELSGSSFTIEEPSSSPEVIIPAPRKKKTVTEGGC